MTRAARMPSWVVGLVTGVLTFAVSLALFTAFVHHSYAGRYDGPFLISVKFGVTAAEAEQGVAPVCPEHIPGWDGQFYFHVAGDPLALGTDTSHFDSASYRYQRVGVPALAYLAGGSAFAYHLVQLLLIAGGAGVLAGWLHAQELSPWYALGWVGAAGPLYTMSHGLTDGAGDAVLVFALAALWYRKLGWYAVAATLLVLIREGYAVVAFAAFVGTAIGRVAWDSPASRWKLAAITAIPGVVLVAWVLYLWHRFGVEPWSPERSPSGLYGWPFQAFWKSLRAAFQAGDANRFRLMLLAGFTVAVVLWYTIRRCRDSSIYACSLPYVVLTACLGMIVWEYPEGFLKASASVLVVAVFLLAKEQSMLLRFVLAANVMAGVEWNVVRHVVTPAFYAPEMRENTFADPPTESPRAPDVTDHRGTVRWDGEAEVIRSAYQGVHRRWHREMVTLDIDVTNRSAASWPTDVRWDFNGVEVGYAWLSADGKRVVDGGWLRPPGGAIRPGETRRLQLPVRIARRGTYILKVAMCQNRRDWFDLHGGESGFNKVVRVE